jgi:hypothetical protein
MPVRRHVRVVGVGDAIGEQPGRLSLQHRSRAHLPGMGGEGGEGALQREGVGRLPQLSGGPAASVAGDVVTEPGRTSPST